MSSDGNKLLLCSALRPVQHLSLVAAAAKRRGENLSSVQDNFESGGEDWPSAYRYTPMIPAQARFCVVVLWHCEWGCVAYQIYYGELFGLPLAVTSFNRYPKLCEAMCRRWLCALCSFYFDDMSVQDWASCKGSGQQAIGSLMRELGTEFQPEKQQRMSSEGDFLGLVHDLSAAVSAGVVKLWVRDRLQDKLIDMMQQARREQRLMSGAASKLYGTANFFEQGTFGKIGRAGLNAVKDRQQESRNSSLTPAILQGFDILEAVLQDKPRRAAYVYSPPVRRFLAASDAALEDETGASGGFLLVGDPTSQEETRDGFVVNPQKLKQLWHGKAIIAQLELAMVLVALLGQPDFFRGRRGIWFIDNVAALMALVRGRSDAEDLDRMAVLIHGLMYGLQCMIYFEWVESKANWADGISRDGYSDLWHRKHGFSCSTCPVHEAVWVLPFRAVLRLGTYL